ncbi:MAG: hypothetical protein V9E82_12440 [Candidatus Nanopelagicales bacterium]
MPTSDTSVSGPRRHPSDQVQAAHLSREFRAGIAHDRRRRPAFHDPPALHDQQVVGQQGSIEHLVGDQDRGPSGQDRPQGVPDLCRHTRVEGG